LYKLPFTELHCLVMNQFLANCVHAIELLITPSLHRHQWFITQTEVPDPWINKKLDSQNEVKRYFASTNTNDNEFVKNKNATSFYYQKTTIATCWNWKFLYAFLHTCNCNSDTSLQNSNGSPNLRAGSPNRGDGSQEGGVGSGIRMNLTSDWHCWVNKSATNISVGPTCRPDTILSAYKSASVNSLYVIHIALTKKGVMLFTERFSNFVPSTGQA